MSKQSNLKNYYLKPNGSKDKDYVETEMQFEITETAADDAVALAEKKQKCQAFRPEWKDKYPWLRCDIIDASEKMFHMVSGEIFRLSNSRRVAARWEEANTPQPGMFGHPKHDTDKNRSL